MFKVKEGINLNGALVTNPSGTLTCSSGLSLANKISTSGAGVDGSYADQVVAFYSGNGVEANSIGTSVSTTATNSGFQFKVSDGGGSANRTVAYQMTRGNHLWNISGSTTLTLNSSGLVATVPAQFSQSVITRVAAAGTGSQQTELVGISGNSFFLHHDSTAQPAGITAFLNVAGSRTFPVASMYNANTGGALVLTSSNSPPLIVNRTTAGSEAIILQASGTQYGSLAANSTASTLYSNNGAYVSLYSGSNEGVRVLTSGTTAIMQNMNIGAAAAPAFALQVGKGDTNANGIGINTDVTPSTQGANITIRPSSSNVGQTAIIIQGYDKTGRWCMNGQDGVSSYDLTFYSGPAWTPQVIMYAAGGMKVNGNFYATGNVYTEYSDINLKTQLGKIENAVDKICAIDTFYYEPNALALSLGALPGRRVGVSAQSVQQVAEEVVGPSALGKEYLTVQYERLIPYLIEAIKEQQETIKKQQEQINALLAKSV